MNHEPNNRTTISGKGASDFVREMRPAEAGTTNGEGPRRVRVSAELYGRLGGVPGLDRAAVARRCAHCGWAAMDARAARSLRRVRLRSLGRVETWRKKCRTQWGDKYGVVEEGPRMDANGRESGKVAE